MLPFEVKVASFIRKHKLIIHGDSILVGVSGGPDSIALLHYLVKRKDFYKINIVAAHVDHMLRGEESYEDLLFVKELCRRLGIRCETARINIKEKMNLLSKGSEETARIYRYIFFEEIMKKNHHDKLILGHHGDDQIETILMRLTRGSTGKGRAGIPFRRDISKGELVRPLLCLTKQEIEEYCTFYHLEPRRDLSNQKPDYTRNRFRLNVLPFLKKENAHVHEHFQRFSEHLLEDETFLQELTLRKMNKLWNKNKNKITFEIPPFLEMPLSLQRRGIQLILNYLYNENPSTLTSVHTEAVLRLLTDRQPSASLDLPLGLMVKRSYHQCDFSFEKQDQTYTYEIELFENDEVDLPNGYTIRLTKGNLMDQSYQKGRICLSMDEFQLPLVIRNKRPGDRMKVKGLNGTKKVKDIFIDEKIPKDIRSMWPVVSDKEGNILWIPNLKKSIYDQLPNPDQPCYILKYCKQTSSRGQTCQ